MIIAVRKIGNSQGVILPKQLIDICGISDKVSVTVEGGQIIISAAPNPREGWDAQYKAAIAKGDIAENDIFGSHENDFDKEEWTW